MIIDKITNIDNYKEIPYNAKNFIKNLYNDIKVGKYSIKDDDYANIEVYITKKLDNAKFESHQKYIDIQLLLSGKEKIYIHSSSELNVSVPYNKENDIIFYNDSVVNSDFVTLDTTNFVLLYPHEAHAPQIALEEVPSEVKKVVVKIKIR